MADPNSTLPPELASILATLAQFATPQQLQSTTPAPAITVDPRLQGRHSSSRGITPTPQLRRGHPPDHNYDSNHLNTSSSSTTLPGLQNVNAQSQPHSSSSNPYNPQAAVFQPAKSQGQTTPQQEQTIIDPATITEWSAGLRCVTKIAAQNPLFPDKIRGMMDDQRRNEMQWYSSRQTLKQTQAKRAAGANEIQNILATIGGSSSTAPTASQPLQTAAEKEAELAAFDRKIYKAQTDMEAAMTHQLKTLGVPFFGTHASLILPDGVDAKSEEIQGDRPKWSPRITAKDLLELKRRMIAYLEDMYKMN